MANEQELASLLVKIKFAQDEATLKKLESSTSSVASKIGKGFAALGAVVLTTQKIIYDYTKNLSDAFLVTKNLGDSSIQSFKALGKAAEDVGSSVEEMSSALQGLQKFKRTIGPNATSYLRQFAPDIKTEDSATTIMEKLIRNVPTLKKNGMTEQHFLAAMEPYLGYETSYQLYENPEKLIERTKAHEEARGTAEDKLAPQANSAIQQMNLSLSKLAGGIAETIGPKITETIKKETEMFEELMTKFKDNTGSINTAMDKVTGMFGEMKMAFEKQGTSLEKISSSLERISHPLDFIIDHIGTIFGLGTAAGFGKAAYSIVSKAETAAFKDAMLMVENGAISIKEVLKSPALKEKYLASLGGKTLGVIGAGLAGYDIASLVNDLLGNPAGKLGSDIYDATHNELGKNLYTERLANTFKSDSQVKRQTIIEELRRAGLSNSSIAGMLGNLVHETSGFDPFAVGDSGQAYGILQWHPDRQKNYEKLFGHSMQSVKSESQAIKEQADFIAWERSNTERNNWARIESVADDPFQRGAAISRMYVRPGQTEEARSAAAQERGLAAIQAGKSITNNTTININGGDTAEVRRTVEDVNRRNNQFDSRMLQQVYN